MATRVADSPSANSSSLLSSSTDSTATVFFLTVTSQAAVLSPALAVIVAVPSLTAVTTPPSTVATSGSDEVQVTVLSVALSGFTVATRVAEPPSVSSSSVLSSSTDSTAMTFFSTVTLQVAVLSPALAVIVAVPSLTAVIFPPSTVATAGSDDDQLTVLSVASSGLTVAVIVSDSPSVSVSSDLDSVTELTSTVFATTVTAHEAVNPPSTDFTVIEVDPALRAVTLPLLTVATDLSLLSQVTDWLSAFEGETVAVKSAESPSVNESEVGFTVIPVTFTGWGSF